MRVLPRTAAVNAAEANLQHALVAMVWGHRPPVSPTQVYGYLEQHFHVAAHEVQVRCFRPDDFLLVFSSYEATSRVLLAAPLDGTEFTLLFHRWRRQARAFFSPLRYKVLLALENLPALVTGVCAGPDGLTVPQL
jgi:hypothetical protein